MGLGGAKSEGSGAEEETDDWVWDGEMVILRCLYLAEMAKQANV